MSIVGDNKEVEMETRRKSAALLTKGDLRRLLAECQMSDRVDAHTDHNTLVDLVVQSNCIIPSPHQVSTPVIHAHEHKHVADIDIHTQTQPKKKNKDSKHKKQNRTDKDKDKDTQIDIDIRTVGGNKSSNNNKLNSTKKTSANNKEMDNDKVDISDVILSAISDLRAEMKEIKGKWATMNKDEGKSVFNTDSYAHDHVDNDDAIAAAIAAIPAVNTHIMPSASKSVRIEQDKRNKVEKVSKSSSKGRVGNRVGADILNLAGIDTSESKYNNKKGGYNHGSVTGTNRGKYNKDVCSDVEGDSEGSSDENSDEPDNARAGIGSSTSPYYTRSNVANSDTIIYEHLAQECSRAAKLHGGFYKYIHEREFTSARNKYECESIGRALDKLIQEDGVPVDASVGIEHLVRRLVGVQQADFSGEWSWATAIELNDHSTSLLTMHSLKQLSKRVNLLKQVKPANHTRKQIYGNKYTGTDQDGQQSSYTYQRGGYKQRGNFRGGNRGNYRGGNRGGNRGASRGGYQSDGASNNNAPANASNGAGGGRNQNE